MASVSRNIAPIDLRDVEEQVAQEPEEALSTAPFLNDSAGDTLNNSVPFDALYQRLVRHACEQLSLTLGRHYGPPVISAILLALPNLGPDHELLGRAAKADLGVLEEDFYDWDEIAVDFNLLFAFARHGEISERESESNEKIIEDRLKRFRIFVLNQGLRSALDDDFDWFTDTLWGAEARWAIDRGDSIDLEWLASLAGVKKKTIANLISSNQIPTEPDGRVSAVESLRYLEKRKDFTRSSWQKPPSESAPNEAPSDSMRLSDQVFVPIDAEGNAFLPSLARRSRNEVLHYTIGEKVSPVHVEDYWDALTQLSRMQTPRWRRPSTNKKGGWGLVSAQDGWRRFARADLDKMIDVTRSKTAGE